MAEPTPLPVSRAVYPPLPMQQVIESLPDSALVLDRAYIITFANRRALELLQAGPLVGHELWTLFPHNAQEPFSSAYRLAMEGRVSQSFEAFYPDPYFAWFRISAEPLGEGILILFRNIHAHKLAEIERDRMAGALGQVLEVTNDGVVAVNRSWEITFVNRRAAELTASVGDVVGKSLWQLFSATASLDAPYYHQAMNERVASCFDTFYPAPLGLWFRMEACPAPDGLILFFRDITADRAAAQKAQQQTDLLYTVQEAGRIATWELDLASGAMRYGSGSYPVFGHMLQELPTLASIEQWIPEPSRGQFQQQIRLAIEAGGPISSEFPIAAAHGELLWVESRGKTLYVQGRPTLVHGISIDVTARRRSEEQLRLSETRYRTLTDLNPQLIFTSDPQGSITYGNQRLLAFLGLHAGDIRGGAGWEELIHPDDREALLTAWKRSIQTGVEFRVQARVLRASDATYRWLEISGLPLRDEVDGVTGWLGIAIDVHESRSLTEALRAQQLETERQRTELESIYENTPIGLALFDPVEFRYLRLNDELARTIGLPKEKVLGRSVLEIVPGVATIGELFRQVATGKPVRNRIVEAELPNQPGNTRSWNVNYFPVRDATGAITGITSASLEITQQRKAEAALIQAEKLAAVGRLASSISHEINNPLEAITNLLYLVAQSPELPPDLKVFVHMAQSELQRVSQIATQTLRFHRQAVGATLVTAAQLVDAVLNLYQGRLSNSGIEVSASYQSATGILCFENDIRQVLNNLIANAIDAMRTGGRLLVRAHDTRDVLSGQPGVRIAIADTGHGMSRTTLRRLFEAFYTTKGMNGTGLGLWISSEIVNRHQGRLSVRSSQHPVHHGTVFTLFLPLRETVVAPRPEEELPVFVR